MKEEKKVIHAALLGAGTVGGGVYKLAQKMKKEILHRIGCELNIKKVLVRDASKQREGIPKEVLTDNWDEILNDKDIRIVIELMGGTGVARSRILDAFTAGKHVVTANKDLLAEHGAEIFECAKMNNCDIQFENNGEMHKEGTAFSGIEQSLFKEFVIEKLYWPMDQFVPYGISREAAIERASQAKTQPLFVDGFIPEKKGRKLAYRQLSEVLREGDVLCYFAGEPYEEDGEMTRNLYADNIPDDYHGEEHLIDLVFTKHYYDSIHYSFHEFLQYAHNNPDKYFVLCDFKETLDIDKNEEQKTAIQFWEWYEHKIPNVIMPFWILNRIAGLDMIGRD